MQNESFLQFTFSLQLQTGSRLHGHVRRYLPPHLVARTRYDVGRRGERALVVLTRATGADLLYAAILKSVEAISSQQAAMSTTGIVQHGGNPQQWFLHQLSRHQQHLSKVYGQQPASERGKPLIAAISGIELGDHHEVLRAKYQDFDNSRYIIPISLLVRTNALHSSRIPPQAAAGSIVPLLRCVGVAHAVRILSERRIVLVSSSLTRLAVCSHAAVSILAIGLLHWQHLYIPVLPPHLWQYLAAPYPYLIGILTGTVPRLDRTEGLGEVLIIHLDTNQMETRGMETSTIMQRLPDLFRTGVEQIQQQLPNSLAVSTASEMLAQELFEVLKQDKKVLYGESTFNKVGETAAIATKAVKQTFFKLRDKGRQYLQQRNQSGLDGSPASLAVEEEAPTEVNSMASDYIYTECCHNEVAEQEARIAFTSFFLCMIGDMRWYLSYPPESAGEQPLPVLDRKKFLKQKRAAGDGEGTPMWPLLNNFCQTQMLEEFAKARIEEVRKRAPVAADMPLFLQCESYGRQNSLNFSVSTCRRITRQVADGSPARLTGLILTNARRTAMALTSNKAFEGDFANAIAQLVEQCRESTSNLFDVMSVIWLRLRDSRGMQWKHAYRALLILRNLLHHGPMAAISEATDGLSKIRALKYYDNIRSQSVHEVRIAASTVYNLLIDRAKLFQIRRVCTERRRVLQSTTEPKRIRHVNAQIRFPFRNIHAMMHPTASSGTVVLIPPKVPTSDTMVRGSETPQRRPASAIATKPSDLLDRAHHAGSGAADDLVGLFDVFEVTSPSVMEGVSSSKDNSNPFDAFAPVATNPNVPRQSNAPIFASPASVSLAIAQTQQTRAAPVAVTQNQTHAAVSSTPNTVPAFAQAPQQLPQHSFQQQQQLSPIYGQAPPQQQQSAMPQQQYNPNHNPPGQTNARVPSGPPVLSTQYGQQPLPLTVLQQHHATHGTQYGAPQGAPLQQHGHPLQPGVPAAFPQQRQIRPGQAPPGYTQQQQQQQHQAPQPSAANVWTRRTASATLSRPAFCTASTVSAVLRPAFCAATKTAGEREPI